MDPAILSRIEAASDLVRIPTEDDKVYKDECIYSFATSNDQDGLFICLNKWWAFSRTHAKDYSNLTSNSLFLRIKKRKRDSSKADKESQLKDNDNEGAPPAAKSSRKDTVPDLEEFYELILLPEFHKIPLPNDQLPEKIQDSIKIIQSKTSASISDLKFEEVPSHLFIGDKQYTTEDPVFIEDLKRPVVPDPIFITRWYGKSQRNSYGGGGSRSHSHFGGSNAEDRNQREGNRNDGTHFRPWR